MTCFLLLFFSGYVSFREKYPELTENLTKDVVKNTLENGFPGMLPIRDHQVILINV